MLVRFDSLIRKRNIRIVSITSSASRSNNMFWNTVKSHHITLAAWLQQYFPTKLYQTSIDHEVSLKTVFCNRHFSHYNLGPAPLNVAEYERYAADTLSRNTHGYYASGSNDMITLRENREAYSRLRLMPKILVDVSSINTGKPLQTFSTSAALRQKWPLSCFHYLLWFEQSVWYHHQRYKSKNQTIALKLYTIH